HADRDSVRAVGTTLGGATGDRAEQASMNRTAALGTVLTIIALPAVTVPFQAAHFYRSNRDNRSIVSSGEERTYLLYVPKRYGRTAAGCRSRSPARSLIASRRSAWWGRRRRSRGIRAKTRARCR